jgi:hypothetical protein
MPKLKKLKERKSWTYRYNCGRHYAISTTSKSLVTLLIQLHFLCERCLHIENKLVKLKIANKGGYIVEATLKNFERFTEGSGQLVKLIKDNNAHLNVQLLTSDNRTLNTKDLYLNQP